MRVAEALNGVARLFQDSAPLIYVIERHLRYAPVVAEVFSRIDDGSVLAITSPVTLAECLILPYRHGKLALHEQFQELIVRARGVTFVPIDAAIAARAAELRGRYNLSLPDSFQVSVALATACDALLTNDLGLKRVAELQVLVVDELEV